MFFAFGNCAGRFRRVFAVPMAPAGVAGATAARVQSVFGAGTALHESSLDDLQP
jgi:hypothetical protein